MGKKANKIDKIKWGKFFFIFGVILVGILSLLILRNLVVGQVAL